jgi:hypothetical protein
LSVVEYLFNVVGSLALLVISLLPTPRRLLSRAWSEQFYLGCRADAVQAAGIGDQRGLPGMGDVHVFQHRDRRHRRRPPKQLDFGHMPTPTSLALSRCHGLPPAVRSPRSVSCWR